MLRVASTVLLLMAVAAAHPSLQSNQPTQKPLRIIAFGAHPDDAELKASGVAALWAAAGHKVKFVAMTNGDVGHFEQAGGPLAKRRKAEVAECGEDPRHRERGARHPRRRTGAVAGEPAEGRPPHPRVAGRHRHGPPSVRLPPGSPLYRRAVERHRRGRRRAVLRPRHPADSRNPVYMNYSDGFQDPKPFTPTIVVGIDGMADKKWKCISAMPSQFGDKDSWQGRTLPNVPQDERERQSYLLEIVKKRNIAVAEQYRERLIALYGPERGKKIQYAEAFELNQYGRQASLDELKQMFPGCSNRRTVRRPSCCSAILAMAAVAPPRRSASGQPAATAAAPRSGAASTSSRSPCSRGIGEGKPITDLTRDEITVLENGAPQTLVAFDKVSFRSRGRGAAARPSRSRSTLPATSRSPRHGLRPGARQPSRRRDPRLDGQDRRGSSSRITSALTITSPCSRPAGWRRRRRTSPPTRRGCSPPSTSSPA